MRLGIGLVGCGYWGANLLRNLLNNDRIEVRSIADANASAREKLGQRHPAIAVVDEAGHLIARKDIDAVVIATPVSTHYDLARKALDAGKHVLVEKPFCESSLEAEDLIARAARAGRVLMVDHTFLFTGAVQAMAKTIRGGELGKICYFDSTRINLGLFQPDTSCLWDLAPHDLAVVDHLLGLQAVAVEASGYCHVDPLRPDMAFVTLHYPGNVIAHLNLSWMSPVKVRRFLVGGTKKMLMWDDLDADMKVKIFDHGIDFQPEHRRSQILPSYRLGDIYAPRLSRQEALAGVAEHFVAVINGEIASVMDGECGLRIVRVLEMAQADLTRNLRKSASGLRAE